MSNAVSFPDWLVWDHICELRTEEELIAYHERVSLVSRTENLTSIRYVVLGLPFALFLIGTIIAAAYAQVSLVLFNPTIYIFSLTLFTSLKTIYWFDQAGFQTLLEIRSSFDVADEEYYRLMGEFVERLYEPLPYAPRPSGKVIHEPTFIAIGFGIIVFIVIPLGIFSDQMSTIFGIELGASHIALQIYIITLLLMALLVGVVTSWIVFVGAYFMSYRIQQFPITLDITRRRDNLGLAPYAQVVLKALLPYLFVYILVSSLLVIRHLNMTFVVAIFFFSLLPLVGFVGSQYGLHRTIERTKSERLQELRTEFDDELKQWFLTGEPEPPDTTETDIAQFVMAKEAIDELPEWPVQISSVAQLVSATVASNIWVLLQVIGVIS